MRRTKIDFLTIGELNTKGEKAARTICLIFDLMPIGAEGDKIRKILFLFEEQLIKFTPLTIGVRVRTEFFPETDEEISIITALSKLMALQEQWRDVELVNLNHGAHYAILLTPKDPII